MHWFTVKSFIYYTANPFPIFYTLIEILYLTLTLTQFISDNNNRTTKI